MQIISFFPTLSTKMPHLVPNEYESSQINMFATFCKPVSQVSVRNPPHHHQGELIRPLLLEGPPGRSLRGSPEH